jgi:hypothetical protein
MPIPNMIVFEAERGAKVLTGSPDDYARFVADETDKWGVIVKSIGARAD